MAVPSQGAMSLTDLRYVINMARMGNNDECARALLAIVEGRSPVITTGDAQALVADAEIAHALNSTFSDTEVETALDALGTKINAILDVLIAARLMAAS